MLGDARIYSACAIVLVYVAGSIYFLWIAPRRRTGSAVADDTASLLIAFASQTGFAEQLAHQTAQLLHGSGVRVRLDSLGNIRTDELARVDQALFIVSTTGEGDAPDSVAPFVDGVLSSDCKLAHLRYGVLALGDREYASFCAFGHRLDVWLRHQGATPLFDVIEVDNGDMGSLRHWQHQLSVVTNTPDLPDWQPPTYDRWRLTRRVLMNPGSKGDPCFHIELEPASGDLLHWSAGDILEIDPQNSTWRDPASPLPHREYSIASLPQDGSVHLLVREMRRADGTLGLGSGWLSRAEIGNEIAARIRINRNFHAPADDRPLILIGNGTGIAGLRSLIKQRIAVGHSRNWLIFGERNRAADAFYAPDIEQWQRTGALERLDLVFSRDQADKRYVQHRLRECGDEVRAWIDAGAAIYVCGSLQGMAPAVNEALEHIVGTEKLERLAAQGRYRRDVY